MIFIYKFALVVLLSTAPDEVIVYQFETWQACKAREAELIAGMKDKIGEKDITVDCRRDVQVNMGSR
jgi:hypothetical protein